MTFKIINIFVPLQAIPSHMKRETYKSYSSEMTQDSLSHGESLVYGHTLKGTRETSSAVLDFKR